MVIEKLTMLGSAKGWAAAILAVLLCPWHLLLAQTTSLRPVTKERHAYAYKQLYLFRGNGYFATIDLEEGVTEAMWNLARVRQLEQVFPTPEPQSVEHGWIFRPFHVSPDGRRLFGVSETADGLGDAIAGNIYQLVELELPAMMLVKVVRLPGRGNNVPTALMSPEGKHIYTTIWPSSQEVKAGVYMYRADDFELEVLYTDMLDRFTYNNREYKRKSQLSSDAYFHPNGLVAYDGTRKVEFEDRRLTRTRVSELEGLLDEDRKQLEAFEWTSTSPSGSSMYFQTRASAGGKALAAVWKQDRTASAFWTVDLHTEQTTPVISVEGTWYAHLLPSGDRVILRQRLDLINDETGYLIPSGEITGRFLLYDVSRRTPLREFSAMAFRDASPYSYSRPLCFSPDSRIMIYATRESVYQVDLEEAEGAIDPDELVAQKNWSGCAFAP